MYDELDRVITASYAGNTLNYYYGSNGEIGYITDSKTGTRTQYEYDLSDRIVSIKEFGDEESYLFDLNSSLSYTYIDKTVFTRINNKTKQYQYYGKNN